jgi:hypothetical protein
MTQTFTQNDVIRYFYNEVTTQEKRDIQNAMLWDNDLQEFYQELVQLKRSLNKIKKEPSDRVIQNILNYSRSFSLLTA